MKVLVTPAEARQWADEQHREGRRIGLVPTMGALHPGHLDLMDDAARRADRVCVSIFVNPLQFNENVDFTGYPRPIDDDLQICERHGVDVVYAPTAAAMYPDRFQTRVVPGALAEEMEGAMRPGHFAGVTTVVTKLLTTIRPDVAIFGQKDYQQLLIVERLAADLDLGVEIVGHPIVREADGLAMSSRNVRLTHDQRSAASCIHRSLDAALAAAANQGATVDDIVNAARAVVDAEPLARHEYTTVFDAETLHQVRGPLPVGADRRPVRVATAVWFGGVRLIDNRQLTLSLDSDPPQDG
jgi:pantoate--beta-alanine ligase